MIERVDTLISGTASSPRGSGEAAPVRVHGESYSRLVVPQAPLFDRSRLEITHPFVASLLLENETLGELCLRSLKEPLIITIDGPGAVGKGTTGQKLAKYFGVPFFSSGITFRVPALIAFEEIPAVNAKPWTERRRLQDRQGIEPLSKAERAALHRLVLELTKDGRLSVENTERGQRVIVRRGGHERDITEDAYLNPEASVGASILGEIGVVRRDLLPFQRRFGALGCVTDGRDMGTTVFPQALIKFYFGGAPESRALWRLDQRLRNLGRANEIPTKFPSTDAELEAVLRYCDAFYREAEEIESRDRHDKTRKHSPLRKPEGAITFSPAEYLYDEGSSRPSAIRCYSEQESFEIVKNLALDRLQEILKARLAA